MNKKGTCKLHVFFEQVLFKMITCTYALTTGIRLRQNMNIRSIISLLLMLGINTFALRGKTKILNITKFFYSTF